MLFIHQCSPVSKITATAPDKLDEEQKETYRHNHNHRPLQGQHCPPGAPAKLKAHHSSLRAIHCERQANYGTKNRGDGIE